MKKANSVSSINTGMFTVFQFLKHSSYSFTASQDKNCTPIFQKRVSNSSVCMGGAYAPKMRCDLTYVTYQGRKNREGSQSCCQ